MSLALTQIGASNGTAAYAAGGRPRAELAVAAADRMHGESLRAVAPVAEGFPVRDQIRDEVLADRGLDRIALAKLGPQARLEAEISVNVETARRLHQAEGRTTGHFVDIRA